MPINANAFNSRITSEALEKKFRDTFPAQGGAELIQDLFASGVIVPTVDFSDAALGSGLPQTLQQAWDFSTSIVQAKNTTVTVASNPGFWKVGLTLVTKFDTTSIINNQVFIDDGTTTKPVWAASTFLYGTFDDDFSLEATQIYVYLRAGDTLKASTDNIYSVMDVWTRQIADVSGNLVNPLGFTSS